VKLIHIVFRKINQVEHEKVPENLVRIILDLLRVVQPNDADDGGDRQGDEDEGDQEGAVDQLAQPLPLQLDQLRVLAHVQQLVQLRQPPLQRPQRPLGRATQLQVARALNKL